MTIEFLNVYNNLVNLTTNKKLYISLKSQDTFSDRLTIFLTHFAFFLKVYKTEENKKILQEIYDFNFRQMELSIREIGYGDQSINKKMKDYINVFHAILSDIHFWDTMNNEDKINKLSKFFNNYEKIDHLIEYFNDFNNILSKKTLNSFLKSVSNS
tara:strand:- start:263 stop:730 length:468 start_codon:yes stop_codon:yes gene_type:complete